MTPKQYKAAIEKLGISQEAAGVFFGYSPRQGQRWANKERAIPLAVGWCLEFMLKYGIKPGDLNKDFK
jgi:hypothetical protein